MDRCLKVSLFCLYISKLKFCAGFKMSVLPWGLNAMIYAPSFSFGILKPDFGVALNFEVVFCPLCRSVENYLRDTNLEFVVLSFRNIYGDYNSIRAV